MITNCYEMTSGYIIRKPNNGADIYLVRGAEQWRGVATPGQIFWAIRQALFRAAFAWMILRSYFGKAFGKALAGGGPGRCRGLAAPRSMIWWFIAGMAGP
jgi:hypothetical protein